MENGTPVWFHSRRGTALRAVVEDDHALGSMTRVRVGQDPFPTYVPVAQLELIKETKRMTRTKPAEPLTRELRQQARDQGVEDWETLSREELSQAVQGNTHGEEPPPPDEDAGTPETPEEEAEEAVPTATKRTRSRTTKATTSKAKPAAKKTATKAAPTKRASSTTAKAKVKAAPRPVSTGPNPFTPGTKLHLITEQLIKGGKRSDLVKALRGKLDFHPRARGGPDFDQDEETDRRLKIVGYLLKQKFGWTYSLEPDSNGKYGKNSYIKCTPPKGK